LPVQTKKSLWLEINARYRKVNPTMIHVQYNEITTDNLYQTSAKNHHNLCPRQVLGVRMGLYAGELLDMELPQREKRLFTLIESDGCFLDGVAVSTGCSVGSRTMKIYDFGKMAATFAGIESGEAIRITPNPAARDLCKNFVDEGTDRWHTYLEGYQVMPCELLFNYEEVKLFVSLEAIISRSGVRAVCSNCGEEIFNEREVRLENGKTLCKACAGQKYYAQL